MLNPILIAIPIFFIGIGLEWTIARRKHLEVYRWNDTLTNLHLGTGQVLISTLIKAPQLALYYYVWGLAESLGLPRWGEGLWTWIGAFILMDAFYYFFHRYSHEFNFLWAAHAVHHQSEEYNLSVALRQSWIQNLFSGFFYLPMALLGVPVKVFFIVNALNTLFQFWIHTRLISTIGPLEWILNTPAHHRVHHGVDDEYVDKNYAGVFIIWDRMFGTFTPEQSPARYGVIKPLRSWNTGWANIDIWAHMWGRMREGSLSLIDRALLPLRAPAWRGEAEPPLQITLRTDTDYQNYDPQTPWSLYVIISGGLSFISASWVIHMSQELPPVPLACWVSAHLVVGISLGGLMEGRRWALPLEGLRLISLPMLAIFYPLSSSDGGVEISRWLLARGVGLSLASLESLFYISTSSICALGILIFWSRTSQR